MTQEDIYKLVCENDGIEYKEIMKELNISKTSTSSQVNALRRKKMVRIVNCNKILKVFKY